MTETATQARDRVAVANTILQQLGGNIFMVMTGAHKLTAPDHYTLQFSLPGRSGFAKSNINRVQIRLNPSLDLYDVEFSRVRKSGLQYVTTVVSQSTGVYAEDLGRVFTEATGLYTRMFSRS